MPWVSVVKATPKVPSHDLARLWVWKVWLFNRSRQVLLTVWPGQHYHQTGKWSILKKENASSKISSVHFTFVNARLCCVCGCSACRSVLVCTHACFFGGWFWDGQMGSQNPP